MKFEPGGSPQRTICPVEALIAFTEINCDTPPPAAYFITTSHTQTVLISEGIHEIRTAPSPAEAAVTFAGADGGAIDEQLGRSLFDSELLGFEMSLDVITGNRGHAQHPSPSSSPFVSPSPSESDAQRETLHPVNGCVVSNDVCSSNPAAVAPDKASQASWPHASQKLVP